MYPTQVFQHCKKYAKAVDFEAIVTGWLFYLILSTSSVITSNSMGLIVFSLIYGCCLMILAGFLTSSLAKRSKALNTLVAGTLAEITGIILFTVIQPNAVPIWYHLISLLLTIPIFVLGGNWQRKTTV